MQWLQGNFQIKKFDVRYVGWLYCSEKKKMFWGDGTVAAVTVATRATTRKAKILFQVPLQPGSSWTPYTLFPRTSPRRFFRVGRQKVCIRRVLWASAKMCYWMGCPFFVFCHPKCGHLRFCLGMWASWHWYTKKKSKLPTFSFKTHTGGLYWNQAIKMSI